MKPYLIIIAMCGCELSLLTICLSTYYQVIWKAADTNCMRHKVFVYDMEKHPEVLETWNGDAVGDTEIVHVPYATAGFYVRVNVVSHQEMEYMRQRDMIMMAGDSDSSD